MSQALLAELLGVNVQSVKRWENPDYPNYNPRSGDVWELLDFYAKRQRDLVEWTIANVTKMDVEHGRPEAVQLAYWHSAEDYEADHPGDGRFWQMANANSRLAAYELELQGYQVDFSYSPSEAR